MSNTENKIKSFNLDKIIISLLAIIFLRVFFENFSNPNPLATISPWTETYFHLPLFYFSIFLSLSILIFSITKKSISNIFSFLLKAHLLILLPPIIDLIISKGKGLSMHYIFVDKKELLPIFFNSLNPFFQIEGITPGIKTAITFLILFVTLFIFKKTSSIKSSVLGIIFTFLIFFSYSIIPSLIYAFSPTSDNLSITKNYNEIIYTSLLYGKTTLLSAENIQSINNIILSQIFWVLITLQSIFLFYKTQDQKAKEIIKNSFRFTRILNFSLLSFVGMLAAQHVSNFKIEYSFVNLITLGQFFLLQILALIFCVFVNDEEDIEIDKLTNPTRPLASNDVDINYWKKIKTYLFFFILSGFFLTVRESAFFIVLVISIYYLYSSNPLRLKRHFILSSFSMGLVTLSSALAGYFLVSSDKNIFSLPFEAFLIIGMAQALLSNMKDIKDYKGDKEESVKTIPVVFGEKTGKKIISALWTIVFISIPLIIKNNPLLLTGIIFSGAAIFLFNKKRYEEKFLFIVLFLYMLSLYILIT